MLDLILSFPERLIFSTSFINILKFIILGLLIKSFLVIFLLFQESFHFSFLIEVSQFLSFLLIAFTIFGYAFLNILSKPLQSANATVLEDLQLFLFDFLSNIPNLNVIFGVFFNSFI